MAHKTPERGFSHVLLNQSNIFPMTFADPRYEDEAIAALMEEALTEDSEETKFDVEAYFNGDIDY